MKIKKENGTDLFEQKLKQFGIPRIPIPKRKLTKKDKSKIADFVFKNKNVIIISSDFYVLCVKLLRLKLLNFIYSQMLWLPQSAIDYNTLSSFRYDELDVISLVNLYKVENPNKLDLLGSLINKSLKSQIQVLIGVPESSYINEVFPYDLDTIENNFEIWKVS